MIKILKAQLLIDELKKEGESVKCLTDGYHSFGELYEFRMMYNAALFNEWALSDKYSVHKTLKHHDGELCFGGTHFKVAALLPTGEISNHYKMKYWNLFKCKETKKALLPFDGHMSKDVLKRLQELNTPKK